MTSGLKLTLGAAVLASGIGYLAYAGAASSWQYYLSVDEAVEDGARLNGKRVRMSGRVAAGSLAVGEDRRQATFDLAGELHTVHVTCRCSLPDNLAEDIDVVVEGTLQADGVHGQKVITRCASKYESQNRLLMKNYEASTALEVDSSPHGANLAKSQR
jgi:cytochrome c-type biogenesis protein CcmE